MNTPLHITVMLGGPSAEREVSLRSGRAVVEALRSLGHRVQGLDPRNPDWELPEKTEVVFLALHGTYGEDGTVQERLEEMGVPYTGCSPEASRIAFDKVLTKERCLSRGVPTPRFTIIETANSPWPEGWEPPLVLKPVSQGSSVGLQFVEHRAEWQERLREAFRFDERILVEELVEGREITIGILGSDVLPLVEIRPSHGVFDYHHKYTPGASEYLCPAPFSKEITRSAQQAGWEAFQAVGGRDYARVDAIVRANGEPAVLEVNTLPGMTGTSLLSKAAAAAGIGYAELCQRMVEMALQRQSRSHGIGINKIQDVV
jgi:D-alanine-D-alanine ligase